MMRNSKSCQRLLLLVLCLLFLLTAAGCKKEEAETQPAETVSTMEIESTAPETTQAETLQTEPLPETLPETTPEQPLEDEEPAATGEVELDEALMLPTDPLFEAEPTETALEVAPTETLPDPTEELVPKSQLDQLENEFAALEKKQEKTNILAIIAAVAAGVLLIAAVIFLVFWRKAVKALKKRKHRPAQDPTVRAVAVGKVHGIGGRGSQQDSFTVSAAEDYWQHGVLAVVADGMGGLEHGDQASQTAVMSAVDVFLSTNAPAREKLITMVAAAKASAEGAAAAGSRGDSGTTLLLALLQNGMLDFVSVGDSRVCLYRNGTLMDLNREHSYQQVLLRKAANGEISYRDAVTDDKRGCIACYLGMGELPMVDMPTDTIPALPGDKFILMSDGVYNALTPRELCLALQYPAQEAANAIESFIHSRNFPDQDNYTAVILECQ